MKWITRTFGLKGSWRWACKQMRQGKWVRPASATGTLKYKLDDEGQGRILWTFVRDPRTNKNWTNACLFLSDIEATDWVCVGDDPYRTDRVHLKQAVRGWGYQPVATDKRKQYKPPPKMDRLWANPGYKGGGKWG